MGIIRIFRNSQEKNLEKSVKKRQRGQQHQQLHLKLQEVEPLTENQHRAFNSGANNCSLSVYPASPEKVRIPTEKIVPEGLISKS